ncbi:hypothetical protein CYY_004953 [Polysphondylium violaceum]|uniref:RanBP2-type domain-containing protein n=1 Tax=Polysphondylium violaceum TaxID=133409 RepID=A0A8J4Q4G3_9MYCE|nr:hypothetical protein CYY_004953 [Polysphondylium violaceum]
MESKKKRVMGDQLTKDNYEEEEEDKPYVQEVFADGSTFKKASPEELAKRRIVKLKPRIREAKPTPTPAPVPVATTSTNGATPDTTATSAPVAANPFSSFSFNIKPTAKPAAAATTTATDAKEEGTIWTCRCCETENKKDISTCTVCMVPQPADIKYTLPKSASTSSSSLFNSTPASNITFNTSSLFGGSTTTPINASSLFGGSSTSTSTIANPGSLFGGSSSTTPSAPINPSSLFGGSSSTTTTTPINASSLFGGPSTSTSTIANPGSLFGGSSSISVDKKEEEKKVDNNKNIWKCPCCETDNPSDNKTCSLCMVNKPKEVEAKSETTTNTTSINAASLFGGSTTTTPISIPTPAASLFGGSSSFSFGTKQEEKKVEDNKNTWKCECCETDNPIDNKTCDACLVNKPKEKETKAPVASTPINASSLFGGSSSTSTPINPSSLFGGSSSTTSLNPSSLFGGSSSTSTPINPSSLFGGKIEEKKVDSDI